MKNISITFLILFLISCKVSKIDSRTVNFPKQKIQASKIDFRTLNFPKQENKVLKIPNKKNVWVFVMAGQSNMAGRGFVEPHDTINTDRILTINKNNELIYAKEPIHFYEPARTGLDLGMSFSKAILEKVPDSITVLIIPTAVGGTSIENWIKDKKHRNVELLTNFKNKVELSKSYGQIKAILWHQGESNTKNDVLLSNYDINLSKLFTEFRLIINNNNLPIIIGKLGNFSTNKENWRKLNSKMCSYAKTDINAKIVNTSDLTHRGDKLHFDSNSIRVLGRRYAEKYLESQ